MIVEIILFLLLKFVFIDNYIKIILWIFFSGKDKGVFWNGCWGRLFGYIKYCGVGGYVYVLVWCG